MNEKPHVTLVTLNEERGLKDPNETPRTPEEIVKDAILSHNYTLKEARRLFTPEKVTEEFYSQVTKSQAAGPLRWDDMTTEEKKKYCQKRTSEGLSYEKVAKSVGAGWTKVRNFCKKHGIETRHAKQWRFGVRGQKKQKCAASARSQ